MLIIRPIANEDFPDLYQIAAESGYGFTSLPINEDLLRQKIERSIESFAEEVDQPGDQSYLMVMEDTETGALAGTCALKGAVGLTESFYHYHLGKVVHSSRELNIYNSVETLFLCNDYTGAAELCTLFLREPYRQGLNGRFLSRCRYLILAEHPQRFGDTVIADMRGVSDENGNSPFWQWLEEHFFSLDFPTADYLTGIGNKVFIAELMPKYPIYTSLLSKAAQAVIGKVHVKTVPALKMLQNEGFCSRGYVHIFDAGPTVECDRDQISSVRRSRKVKVTEGAVSGSVKYLVSNCQLPDFRATLAELEVDEEQGRVRMSPDVRAALKIEVGDPVRILET